MAKPKLSIVSELSAACDTTPTTQESIKLQQERSRRASAERRLKDALSVVGGLQAQLDLVLGASEKPAAQKWAKATRAGGKAKVSAIIPISDWHVEERVDPETVGGKNDVDLAEIERRAKKFFQKAAMLVDVTSSLAKIGDIVMPILGDVISGYIHEELMESNQLSPTEAILFASELIYSGIEFLKKETKLPILVPASCGNHGRTTQKMRIATATENSFEFLMYNMMAREYRNDPKVTWLIGKGYHNVVNIRSHKVRFHHGDGLRYQGGIGGIFIPVNKAIAQWNKAEVADLDVFGHYHQFVQDYPHWVCCGTLLGYNAFAVSIKAGYQRPSQTFMTLDEKQGVTMAIPIFVTDNP